MLHTAQVLRRLCPLFVTACLSCFPPLPDAVDSGRPDAGAFDSGADNVDSGEAELDSGFDDAGEDAGLTADSGADSGLPVDAGPLPWYGIIGNGQSLSVGAAGLPVIGTSQPHGALKLFDADGGYRLDGGGVWSLVPLVEPIRPLIPTSAGSEYPKNVMGETPHTALGAQLSSLSLARTGRDFISVQSVVGTSGFPLSLIDKRRGGADAGPRPPYLAALMETRIIKALADDAGHPFSVAALVLTHGESDQDNAQYGAQLVNLWSDSNADLKAITGQSRNIPLVHSQQNTFPYVTGGTTIAASTQAQWRQAVLSPGKIVLVGPKYQYSYGDIVHLDGPGYQRLGEKTAQVIDALVNLDGGWAPLHPTGVSRSGLDVTVHFFVPFPPLEWDEEFPKTHQARHTAWKHGRGFEIARASDGGEVVIDSAAISGSSVVLRLAASAPSQGLVVRYATTPDGTPLLDGGTGTGASGGTVSGRQGALRDSDPFRGAMTKSVTAFATSGSARLVNVGPAADLALFSRRDLVEAGSHLPSNTMVLSKANDAGFFDVSRPWSGPTGNTTVTVRHDHRNYAVQFELAVP